LKFIQSPVHSYICNFTTKNLDGMDHHLLQSMGLDAKSIQAMAQMDPKMLQSFGLDPNMIQHGTTKSMNSI
jgi:hypothetical protein